MRRNEFFFAAAAWMLSACASLPVTFSKEKDPLSPADHVALGDSYEARGEKPLADHQYEAALSMDQHNVAALMALGNNAFEAQQWRQAQSYFKRVLAVAPLDAGASNNWAMVAVAENRHLDQARERVNQALPTAGSLAPYLLDTLANIDRLQGRYTDAQSALDQAAATGPADNTDFQNNLRQSREKLSGAMKRVPS